MSTTTYPNTIDKLKLYFGKPFQINDNIIIRQPTLGQIMDYGELEFYSMLSVFTGNTTSRRLQLWDAGIDWCKISDFELFASLVPGLAQAQTEILFGDLDFTKFKPYQIQQPKEEKEDEEVEEEKPRLILFDSDNNIEIDEPLYDYIALYLRTMFQSFPKREFAKGKNTKLSLIEEERQKLKDAQVLGKSPSDSTLLPIISACVNHPGFKYKKTELIEVGIYEFMDSVARLQVYESTTALLKGMYSGFVDTKGISSEEFNFMREINVENQKKQVKKPAVSLNGKV